ncbi:MAG: hypothetical protein IKN09_01065, partial [Clostridia bacterium]|nr:hypothetical protein [Clostridia bacterium]
MEEEKKEVVEEPVQEPVETPVEQAVETPVEAPASEPVVEAEPVNEEPVLAGEPKKKKPVLLVLIFCLVVAAAIATIILLQPSKKNEEKKDENKIITKNEIKSEFRMTGNSLEKFDLYFLKLENQEKNKVYSPLSIKYALEMLAEGATGEAKEQIDAVIGDYKAKKYDNNDNMSFANAMFVRDTFKDEVKEDYQNMLKDKYNAEIIVDKFENPDNINKWISDKTFKLIDDLVNDVSEKQFFLVNALAIDMKWNYLIHCATVQNRNVPCYSEGGYYVEYLHEKLQGEEDEYRKVSYIYAGEESFESINFNGKENIKGAKVLASFNKYDVVKTLGEDRVRKEIGDAYDEYLKTDEAKIIGEKPSEKESIINSFIKDLNENYGKAVVSTDFMLYDDDNVKGFAKDLKTYNGTTLQYVAIMPKTGTLKEYVDKVTTEDINKVINNLKEMKIENFEEGYATIIEGDIPMFKYEYELNLLEDLKKLGITDVFTVGKASLNTMLKNPEGIVIAEAKHKANIEFSNEGIKAAAATEEGGLGNTGGGFNYLFEVPTKRINLT